MVDIATGDLIVTMDSGWVVMTQDGEVKSWAVNDWIDSPGSDFDYVKFGAPQHTNGSTTEGSYQDGAMGQVVVTGTGKLWVAAVAFPSANSTDVGQYLYVEYPRHDQVGPGYFKGRLPAEDTGNSSTVIAALYNSVLGDYWFLTNFWNYFETPDGWGFQLFRVSEDGTLAARYRLLYDGSPVDIGGGLPVTCCWSPDQTKLFFHNYSHILSVDLTTLVADGDNACSLEVSNAQLGGLGYQGCFCFAVAPDGRYFVGNTSANLIGIFAPDGSLIDSAHPYDLLGEDLSACAFVFTPTHGFMYTKNFAYEHDYGGIWRIDLTAQTVADLFAKPAVLRGQSSPLGAWTMSNYPCTITVVRSMNNPNISASLGERTTRFVPPVA